MKVEEKGKSAQSTAASPWKRIRTILPSTAGPPTTASAGEKKPGGGHPVVELQAGAVMLSGGGAPKDESAADEIGAALDAAKVENGDVVPTMPGAGEVANPAALALLKVAVQKPLVKAAVKAAGVKPGGSGKPTIK